MNKKEIISLHDLDNINIPDIPELAKGYVLPAMNPHLYKYLDSDNLNRSADNLEDISYEAAYMREEVSRLNDEVSKLHQELAGEKQRAKIEEKKNKRLTLLLSILGFF